MSEAQILASLSLWTNFSCCKKILGSVLKRKDTFGDFFSHFFFFFPRNICHSSTLKPTEASRPAPASWQLAEKLAGCEALLVSSVVFKSHMTSTVI